MVPGHFAPVLGYFLAPSVLGLQGRPHAPPWEAPKSLSDARVTVVTSAFLVSAGGLTLLSRLRMWQF